MVALFQSQLRKINGITGFEKCHLEMWLTKTEVAHILLSCPSANLKNKQKKLKKWQQLRNTNTKVMMGVKHDLKCKDKITYMV